MRIIIYTAVFLLVLLQSMILIEIHKLNEIEVVIPEYQPKKYKLLGYSSTKEEIKLAVIEEFGHKMAKIVECESNFKLKAHNPYNKNGSTDSGLFQINSIHRAKAKKMGIDLDTVQGQFAYTRYLVQKNGYKDWVCAKKLGIVK